MVAIDFHNMKKKVLWNFYAFLGELSLSAPNVTMISEGSFDTDL